MATKDSFTPEEWTQLRLTPAMVASGISAADPSGMIATIKEAMAGAQGVAEALQKGAQLELFQALAADRSIPGIPDTRTLLGEGTRDEQLQSFKNKVLEQVSAASELVGRKASPDEADSYRRLLVDVATRAAEAAKEGGFLGFGGVRVSDKERAFMGEVSRAAGLSDTASMTSPS